VPSAAPARARGGQVLKAPLDLLGRCHLARRALVAGLADRLSRGALELLAGRGAALGAGLRRIGGGRHRAVVRAAVSAAPQLLDLRSQCRHLLYQLPHQRPRRLAACERECLCFLASHIRKLPFTEKDSCSAKRCPVNGYARRGLLPGPRMHGTPHLYASFADAYPTLQPSRRNGPLGRWGRPCRTRRRRGGLSGSLLAWGRKR